MSEGVMNHHMVNLEHVKYTSHINSNTGFGRAQSVVNDFNSLNLPNEYISEYFVTLVTDGQYIQQNCGNKIRQLLNLGPTFVHRWDNPHKLETIDKRAKKGIIWNKIVWQTIADINAHLGQSYVHTENLQNNNVFTKNLGETQYSLKTKSQTKFLQHAQLALQALESNMEGIIKTTAPFKNTTNKKKLCLRKIYQTVTSVLFLGNILFLEDFYSLLVPIQKHYQHSSHFPWFYVRFYRNFLAKLEQMIHNFENETKKTPYNVDVIYEHFTKLGRVAKQLFGMNTIVYKDCSMRKSLQINPTQDVFFSRHKHWIEWLKNWKNEISIEYNLISKEHKLMEDALCPIKMIEQGELYLQGKIDTETYYLYGFNDSLPELLKHYENKEWIDEETIGFQYLLFKGTVIELLQSQRLNISFENYKKELKKQHKSWNKAYELIRLIYTDNTLFYDMQLYLRFFEMVYSDSMSEMKCESEFSSIKYLTRNRPNLSIQNICDQEFIAFNGPKTGDEDGFLLNVAKKMLLKYNAPLATNSKFKVSRALDHRLTQRSVLNFNE